MINRLIEWSLRNRFLVVCGVLFTIGWGIRCLYRTPVDAIPDLSENQVLVFADWTGRSPQEVEDQVTYPLSVNLQGLAGVKTVRANSMFGFSLITVLFDEQIDNYFGRPRVVRVGGVATFPPSHPPRRRHGQARAGPHGAGLGLPVLSAGRSASRPQWWLRPWPTPRDAGLVYPLPTQLRAGSRRGRKRRWLRAPISGGRFLSQNARRAGLVARRHGGSGQEQPQRRRQSRRGKRHGIRGARHRAD